MEMPIGEIAKRTDVKVSTIRFYEQIARLPAPPWTEGNQRRYGKSAVDRLKLIRHARELGFEVADIRNLLNMTLEPQASCHQADSIARSHLAEIESRMVRLQSLHTELTRMVDECHHGRVCNCRVIEALADHSLCITEHSI